jgi:hypothetical protein
MLLDRLTERAALGQLLVVHGEAWVGKTALLEDTIASAAGMRTARVDGERVPTRSRSSGG